MRSALYDGDADARAAHAGAATSSATRSRTACSTSTSCPSSSGGCALVLVNRRNVVTLRDARPLRRRRRSRRRCSTLAGDPSIERVLMLDAAARARLRLQPGHRSTGATAPTARSPAWSPSSTTPSASGCPRCCAARSCATSSDKRLHVSPFFGLDQSLRVRVLAARRRGLGAHPRARRRRRAAADGRAARPPPRADERGRSRGLLAPLSAACRCR